MAGISRQGGKVDVTLRNKDNACRLLLLAN